MKKIILSGLLFLGIFFSVAQEKQSIFVDKKGVMRRTDTREEVAFFGVNYTLPFAHAFRVAGYLNKDRKEAIDRDVYHFARLGFNAYRIHIWDVEISDSQGNLMENEHLDLLDYLIGKLKERNIKIVLTAMTNFGNGYPERNIPTGGFSYQYGKCEIHDNPEAIRAQENYITQLVGHVNPYTGKAYRTDPDIVGFEINNEPCHSGTQQQTRAYINRMLAALQKAGNRKPVFYNVSHNMQQTEVYYSTDIQGTTYQWYPIGLVAGHTRSGNFLPYVDHYDIPFSHVRGFENKAKLVYEYDPADIMYSYMHPAMVRSFRAAGFQWITQFAYDPMDMAQYNTEYQTHFLNLAYTPPKAISMKIAAEAAYTLPRNQSFGKYPEDTVFGNFRVSYLQDLSELNSPEKFYYSNTTTTQPLAPERLLSVAGTGNSPVVRYEGTGAYFLDRLEEGLWRLEIMPDAVQVGDPFAKPSLKKEVVAIVWGNWNMKITLPSLTADFTVTGINAGNSYTSEAADGVVSSVAPGVYLLKRKDFTPSATWNAETKWGNIRLGEFVAPPADITRYYVAHRAAVVAESGKPMVLSAQIAGPGFPDSVIVYTDKISFWSDKNPSFKMERTNGYTYQTAIPAEQIRPGKFKYNVVVCINRQQFTFPGGIEGAPLDWDYISTGYWETEIVVPDSEIRLFSATDEYSGMESYSMPEWNYARREFLPNSPVEIPTLKFIFTSDENQPQYFLRKDIKEAVEHRISRLQQCRQIRLYGKNLPDTLAVGFITNTGYTYSTTVAPTRGIVRIPVSGLKQTATALFPNPYPVFLKKYFEPDSPVPFRLEDIEKLELSFSGEKGQQYEPEIGAVWLE
ncbi:MAG: hypothetical protein LBE91_20095 [Tannerella sp.]|jgi:hypothetical protein|nr:hypothetical protein [Tannerella sp.]